MAARHAIRAGGGVRPGPSDRYAVATGRNIGFVSPAEQERLRAGHVFVCGLGGMGGAALSTLVRAGVGAFCLADPDRFEASNLNRQVLATETTLAEPKARVASAFVKSVNPDASVITRGDEWVGQLDAILPRYPVVVNGMDDLRAGVRLYRKAREHGATVIDAYAAPLPSVTRVAPTDPRPEERLSFPTRGRAVEAVSDADVAACLARELEYVVTHSSALERFDARIAAEYLAGDRPRPSFAPVVMMAGELMGAEAIATLLGRPTGTDCRGWFLDPWRGRVERPRTPLVAWVRGALARRALRRLSEPRAGERRSGQAGSPARPNGPQPATVGAEAVR
jgi:molybdopterin/thiamine biosynthesis adenylyltransferase